MRETIGPPMPDSMDLTSLEVSNADREGRRLLALWVVNACDDLARAEFVPQPDGFALTVTQRRTGRCGGGTGVVAIEIAFDRQITPDDVAASINREVAGP